MESNNQKTEARSNNNSFIRWQGRSIEELGKAINLLLGLSLTTAGFVISKLLDPQFQNAINICQTKLLILGISISLVTILLLLFLMYNRLLSFRKTTEIARKREKGILGNLGFLRGQVKSIDKCTWKLLVASIISFISSELTIILGFILIFYSRN